MSPGRGCHAQLAKVPLELISILQQRQVGDVAGRAHRLDLGHDRRQLVAVQRGRERRRESPRVDRTVAVRGTPAAAAMPAMSLPVAVAVGKPPTDRQTLVVEHDVHEIPRTIARQRRESAEVHEHRAVAIEHDDRAARAG